MPVTPIDKNVVKSEFHHVSDQTVGTRAGRLYVLGMRCVRRPRQIEIAAQNEWIAHVIVNRDLAGNDFPGLVYDGRITHVGHVQPFSRSYARGATVQAVWRLRST